MCLLHMSSKELASRISKYGYTTGYVGATGCWSYSQIDKSLVVDEEDKKFFEENQTNVDPSGWWGRQVSFEGKYTFDGSPGVLDYSTPYGGGGKSFLGGQLYSPALEAIYNGLGIPSSQWPQPSLNEFNVYELNSNDGVKIRGLQADYMVFDDWQNPDIIGTGVMFLGDSLPCPSSMNISNIPTINSWQIPFSYLEMCGT